MQIKKKWRVLIFSTLLAVGLLVLVYIQFFKPTSQTTTNQAKKIVQTTPKSSAEVEILLENLEIPWEIAFLPNDDMLITERPGRLIRVGKDKKIIEVDGVAHVGEGGLLGLVIHPKFADNNFIYLYYTTGEDGDYENKVERYKLVDDKLTDSEVIIEGILGSSIHDGGRIAFGPDEYLYITTGDAGETNLAQDKKSLNGKILRVRDDGTIPEANPFDNEVYSYGHRNIQGITWDKDKRLWATEHGRSGIKSGLDELNLIEKGKNYGWPIIQGDEKKEGLVTPVVNSGEDETWAPAGAVYFDESVFFTGLRGQTLYEAVIREEKVVSLLKHFANDYGRLRTVVLGPDNKFYILTSNRDGRGSVRKGDDKLIRVDPQVLQ